MLFARDFGVVGDDVTDDTANAQIFLDTCRDQRQIANFEAMTVRITGPLTIVSTAVVFDSVPYGVAGQGGFHAVVSSGGGSYTALTVTGYIADFNITVFGDGGASFDPDTGQITSDTRSPINGIAFGTDTSQLASSYIRYARAFNLNGFGIRHTANFDSTFSGVSVELCGSDQEAAFQVTTGPNGLTTNECTWVRLQVEQAVGSAITIDSSTLSCTFDKIYSERAYAIAGRTTWVLAGTCVFNSVRLEPRNDADASARIAGVITVANLRCEGDFPVAVDASNGSVELIAPTIGTLTPVFEQIGLIAVHGGIITQVVDIGALWAFHNCQIGEVAFSYTPPAQRSVFYDCQIASLVGTTGQTQGDVLLVNTTVAAASFAGYRKVELARGSRVTGSGASPALPIAYQTVIVDETSQLVGDVTVDSANLQLAGVVQGSLAFTAVPQSLIAPTGYATGSVSGASPPVTPGVLGTFATGMACKNLAPSVTGPTGSEYIVQGWVYVGSPGWVEQRIATGS